MRNLALGLMVIVALALTSGYSFAGKGGGGKGGGKPGGGGDPPPAADPRIVYEEHDGTQWTIKVCNADGTNQTLVLPIDSTSGVAPRSPCWSPDRSRIAYTAWDQGANEPRALFVADADGANVLQIVPGSALGPIFRPTWSPVAAPDGEYKIAFEASLDGSRTLIYVCNTDGSELVRISDQDTVYRSEKFPTWSPDAMSIAAGTSADSDAAHDSEGIHVYLLKADGTTVARDGTPVDATAGTALAGMELESLDWSPTDDVLVMGATDYASYGPRDIWSLDLSTGAAVNLTGSADHDELFPAWSPDGTQIAFRFVGVKKQSKNTGLHTMNADGTGKTRLGITDGGDPDWR